MWLSVLPWALLLVAPACRQANPDWLGPASAEDDAGDVGTTTTAMTTTATTITTGMTTASDTMMGDATTGPMSCNNNNQCADGEVCGPEVCQAGIEGDPCDRERHCSDVAPVCGPMGTCQDGSEGDPCDSAADCGVDAPVCGDAGCEVEAATGG